MKILYAIQATGNGHISRARDIIPLLQKHGEVDILLSGTQADVDLGFKIKYRMHGFSFVYGTHGGVHHYQTWQSMNLFRFWKDMKSLKLKDYNLIINDFEPITAWACKLQGLESVSMGHQASFKSKKVPRPKTIDWGKLILSHYAPTTQHIGFHFIRYDDFIYTPVIRQEIRDLKPKNLGHYTVYLPAVGDDFLINLLKQVPVSWQVFSKHSTRSYEVENVSVQPVNNQKYNESLAGCTGLLTGGGFEGPAEALFLDKKVLIAPMRYQFEQQCNAYALKQLGLPIIWASNNNWLPMVQEWVNNPQTHRFEFPNETEQIVNEVVRKFSSVS